MSFVLPSYYPRCEHLCVLRMRVRNTIDALLRLPMFQTLPRFPLSTLSRSSSLPSLVKQLSKYIFTFVLITRRDAHVWYHPIPTPSLCKPNETIIPINPSMARYLLSSSEPTTVVEANDDAESTSVTETKDDEASSIVAPSSWASTSPSSTRSS